MEIGLYCARVGVDAAAWTSRSSTIWCCCWMVAVARVHCLSAAAADRRSADAGADNARRGPSLRGARHRCLSLQREWITNKRCFRNRRRRRRRQWRRIFRRRFRRVSISARFLYCVRGSFATMRVVMQSETLRNWGRCAFRTKQSRFALKCPEYRIFPTPVKNKTLKSYCLKRKIYSRQNHRPRNDLLCPMGR